MASDFTSPEQFFEQDIGGEPPLSPKAAKRQLKKKARAEKQARRTGKPLVARSENQKHYIASIKENELSFGIGPAGAGKTYVPARLFGLMIANKEIDKLYLARPNISKAKHRNGFLPGTEEEKTAPWLVPIFEGLQESLGKTEFERLKKEKKIEIVPYEFIQGRTFKSEKGAACIVDEAENLDLDDMYITLTRQGENLRMVMCGDIYQARIPDSGLADVIKMTHTYDMVGVGVTEFTEDDVVRSAQARQWVKAFRTHWRQKEAHSVTSDDRTQEGFGNGVPQFMSSR